MNIWIDLTNSPHVTFFKPFKVSWDSMGWDVTITLRDLSNTEELVNQEGWKYQKISGHGGKNRILKLIAFISRVRSLTKALSIKIPDIGMSHSGFCVPLVGRLLGFPTIYLNDNEWALANFLAAPFATVAYFPSLLKGSRTIKWLRVLGTNIKFYEGVKEAIYLSQVPQNSSNAGIRDKVYFRPEPHTADYYSSSGHESSRNIIRQLALEFKVIVLPRDSIQANLFIDLESEQCEIARDPIPLSRIISDAQMFIGAGGTMSRELAILGVPTISIYADNLLSVDKYLIEQGYLSHMSKFDLSFVRSRFNLSVSNKLDLMAVGSETFSMLERAVIELKIDSNHKNSEQK